MKPAAASASGDDLALAAIFTAASVALATWLGAQLAALITTGRTLRATFADAFAAMIRLPSNASDPAVAWGPVGAELPGPVVYWLCTGVVFVGFTVAAWLIVPRLLGRSVGAERSARLGVAPEARLARPRDSDH